MGTNPFQQKINIIPEIFKCASVTLDPMGGQPKSPPLSSLKIEGPCAWNRGWSTFGFPPGTDARLHGRQDACHYVRG